MTQDNIWAFRIENGHGTGDISLIPTLTKIGMPGILWISLMFASKKQFQVTTQRITPEPESSLERIPSSFAGCGAEKQRRSFIMQKRAARRGQRALAFLLCLLMVVTLLPVMGANAASAVGTQPADTVTATEGLEMSKQLTLMSDGTYTINLEAYATGESQTVTQKSGVPLDIVLVIDQSGSMAYNDNGKSTSTESDRRMYKLQEAVRSFVSNISKNAKEFNVEHKIAMVGYASNRDAGRSTSITGAAYNGSKSYWVNTGLYVNGSFKNYAGDSNSSSLTTSDYKNALVSVNDTNGNITSSINTAINNFKASGGTYTEYGMTMAQKIFDNNATRSYTKEDGTTGQSQRIVVLFTDGETNSEISTVLDKANSLKNNSYSATIYCVGFGSSVNSDFLSHVSSNYKTASYSSWFGYSGTQVDTKYSMTANNKTELENIFSNFSKDMTESSSSTELTDAAVLKDIISENFDVTNAQVSAASYKVTTTDGSTYTTGNKVKNYTATLTFDKATKTVSVTGFDYKDKYVAAGHDGEKLVVTITGLLPNQSGTKLYSNNNEKSGIYTKSDDETPFAPFDKPYTSVDTENRVVDFGMTVQIGSNVLNTNAATQQYGTFSLNNNVYAYNLNPVKDNNGNYTFGFTGVDSSLYFNDGSWTKVNVIPANNVYYDDDLLDSSSTFTDGDYGYDVAVENAANNTADIAKGSKKVFTFTGTGIDLYCTTKSDSGSVFAQLRKVNDDNSLSVVPGVNDISMNDTYESGTLYNVPTISFRNLESGKYQVTLYTDKTVDYQLDGVRVYNPGNADVETLYNADEKNATFTKVRDLLLEANSFNDGDASVTGVVYTDQIREGSHNTTAIDTYEKVGPKNEVYLATGNAIAFKVDNYQSGMKVMVGLSAPAEGQNAGEVTMSNGSEKAPTNVNSAVDMYYNVTPNADGYVVIENTGSSLISVTNVKLSGAAAVDATALSVDDGLLTYMASFDTLEVTEPAPVEPEPTPETPANNTVSAIIHAIWAQVKDSIGRLFGRL